MKNKWLIWLVCALLFFSGWTSYANAGMAADSGATIKAEHKGGKLMISGSTDPADPVWVPLIVKDSLGQLLYFQDVSGGGKPFQIEFDVPAWTEYGTAEAVLYSAATVSDSFTIEKDNGSGKKKMDVTLRIVGADQDEIVKRTSFSISKGSSVYQLLQYAAEEKHFDYEIRDPDQDGQQVYLVSIDGLAEFDKGPGSGWVYKVNGKGPPMSIDRYLLKDGDDVEFLYTTDMGKSENVGSGNSGRASYEVSTSADVSAALNQLETAENVESIMNIVRKLLLDLADYDIEKQRTFVPDVAVFFQAAYEQAARLKEKDSRVVNPLEPDIQELSALTAKELLDDQTKLKTELEELLENSSLYKPLLANLKPVLLIPFPSDSDSRVAKLFVNREAWQKVVDSHAILAMVKGDWRTELIPRQQAALPANSIWFSIREFTDQEQTAQYSEWQSKQSNLAAPLTASYRVEASHPEVAKIQLNLPITGGMDESAWPTLYERKLSDPEWKAAIVPLQLQKQRITASVEAGSDVAVVGAANSFEDVQMLDEAHRYLNEPIAALYGWGVVQGMSPTSFGVNETLTRAQFFALLARLQLPKEKTDAAPSADGAASVTFSDVPKNSWYASVVQTAVQRGWTKGRGQNRFAPEASMTRAEVALLLARLYEQSRGSVFAMENAAKNAPGIADMEAVPAWAKHAVLVAADNKWLLPRDGKRIQASAAITRGEAAYAIYQFFLKQYTGNVE